MKALIDGDIVLYRCSASCEPTKIKSFVEPEDVGMLRMVELISRIVTDIQANDYHIFIGGSTNYRYHLYPEYKGNRVAPKPTHYSALRGYLLKTYPCSVTEDIEADDALGIEQTKHGLSSVICSIDKDLLQIPGHHFNFVKQLTTFVSPLDGLRNFYKQLVTGDGTDNIPAFDGKLRGSIPKFVQELLNPIDQMTKEIEMYEYVKELYLASYQEVHPIEIDLHRNAQLLFILRKDNEFWQPPNMNPGPTPATTHSLFQYCGQEADVILQNTKP